MEIIVERRWPKDTYTIGRLYIDGVLYGNTLEDKDRGLNQADPQEYIKRRKIAGETAIPKGKYRVTMNVVSPKYASVTWYKNLCGGKMPRLLEVPCFDGILIHPGSTALDTKGCILVGKNTKVGQLTESRDTFKTIYKLLRSAADKGEQIMLEIK